MRVYLSSEPVDEVDTSLLLLFFFQDEKPLQGATGLIDWRLNGNFSRLIINGSIKGSYGEQLLYIPGRVVRAPKMLLCGLGRKRDFSYFKISRLFSTLMEAIHKLDLNDFSSTLPGGILTNLVLWRVTEKLLEGVIEAVKGRDEIISRLTITLIDEEMRLEEIQLGLQKVKVDYQDEFPITIVRKDSYLERTIPYRY